nr:MAG TPA: hypothetical protein [Caudoviricetes sp.]
MYLLVILQIDQNVSHPHATKFYRKLPFLRSLMTSLTPLSIAFFTPHFYPK